MQVLTSKQQPPAVIRTDLAAIFVSLELSQKTWLITSLSPGNGEKMSKYSMLAGDLAGLLSRFTQLQDKASARAGRRFPIIVKHCRSAYRIIDKTVVPIASESVSGGEVRVGKSSAIL